MKKYLKILGLGVAAGSAIGVGSFLFTICSTYGLKSLGCLLFAVGLFTVCFFGLFLYTGKIGFLLDNKNKLSYIVDLIVGYIGNIIGAVVLGYLLRLIFSSFSSNTLEGIKNIVSSRMVDIGEGGTPLFKPLSTSFFCGILVYFAVHNWKNVGNFFCKTLILVMSVFLFVYFGFEHCIANMFYFSYGNVWNLQSIVNIILVTFGNSLGALFIRAIYISK